MLLVEKNKLQVLFTDILCDYSIYNEYRYGNDDQLALFTNITKTSKCFPECIIATETSHWYLKISALKMMATKFDRSEPFLYK